MAWNDLHLSASIYHFNVSIRISCNKFRRLLMVCQVIQFIPHSAIQAIKNYRFIRLLLDLYAVRKIRPGSIYMNKNNLVE